MSLFAAALGVKLPEREKERLMGLVIAILLLALLLGGVGLVVAALRWLLIVALVLFIAGAITGYSRRA